MTPIERHKSKVIDLWVHGSCRRGRVVSELKTRHDIGLIP